MLMMLAGWPCWGKIRAADADDAGRLAGLGTKEAQLMLMMLAAWRGWGEIRAADDDAGRLARLGKIRAADAHDAGRLSGLGKKQGQLMLMMLAVWQGKKARAADAHDDGGLAGLGRNKG